MGSCHPNARHFPGLLYPASAVTDEKQVLSENDLTLNLLNYYLKGPLEAKNFPAEIASSNYHLWGGINL